MMFPSRSTITPYGVDDGDHEHLDVADLAERCSLPGELGARESIFPESR